MLNINEHILAFFDLKNGTQYNPIVSLENVQSYTVTFTAFDVTNLGTSESFPTDGVDLIVFAGFPRLDTEMLAAVDGITLEEDLGGTISLEATQARSRIFTETTTVDAIAYAPTSPTGGSACSVSDSGFGYKWIQAYVDFTGFAPSNQVIIIATLSTTKAPN